MRFIIVIALVVVIAMAITNVAVNAIGIAVVMCCDRYL